MFRHSIYRHYWWIALLVGGGLVVLSVQYGGDDRVGLVGATIAGTLGFCYFAVQQKLAETQLFHGLFVRFNERYDAMNGGLSDILSRHGDVTPSDRKLVVDYFNLCSEEYLFYKEGYIPADVWRSWCRGMASYLRKHPFRDIWDEEAKSESFYGLTKGKIFEGAALSVD
jgi:hypothetical protein